MKQSPIFDYFPFKKLQNSMKQCCGIISEFTAQLQRFPQFTLIPRRFSTHYWDDLHCLKWDRWWQWGNYRFFFYSCTIIRPTFSSWEQIKERVSMKDSDACLILCCIVRIISRTINSVPKEVYSELVDSAREIQFYNQKGN